MSFPAAEMPQAMPAGAEGVVMEAVAAPAAYGGAPASYIGPTTYAPTKYVSEAGQPYAQGSYAAPYGGAASYSPMPSQSYIGGPMPYSPVPSSSYIPAPVYGGGFGGGSYQPPPVGYGGTASYTPAIVDPMRPAQGQNGSYVSAPGPPPPKLTEGMPDPASVESQKLAYSKSIEAQLRQETGMLAQRNQAQKQSLAQMVQQQKAQYNLQMDQYLQQQAMAVDQQANAEMMMLQEAAMAQKMALEQQAAGLALEYQQRKAQEEMMAREYQIQKQYWDAEQKLAAQYQKQHGIDGRLSEQQLAMGHAAIQSVAGPQMMPPQQMTAMGPPFTTAAPVTTATNLLPPMTVNGGMGQSYAMPPNYARGPQPMMYAPQPQPAFTQ